MYDSLTESFRYIKGFNCLAFENGNFEKRKFSNPDLSVLRVSDRLLIARRHLEDMKFLILVTVVIFLSACSDDATNDNYVQTYNEQIENTEEVGSTKEVDFNTSENIKIEPLPQIFRESFRHVNRLVIIDLATGENMAVYDFDEYDIIENVWNLGDDYYAAWVRSELLWQREERLERLEGNFDIMSELADPREYSELNHRIVIFNGNLDVLEILPVDVYTQNIPSFNTLRFINGELFDYMWEIQEIPTLPMNFVRKNIRSGESEVLFATNNPTNIRSLRGDNYALIETTAGMGVYPPVSYYGILDLTTGETRLLEREYFLPRSFTVRDDLVILSEFDMRMFGEELMNEVIIFSPESMSSEVVKLQHEDSLWARLSYDKNHIVTVNHSNIFRKYNMNGEILFETQLSSSLPEIVSNIAIFPVTETLYTIHALEHFGDRHIFFVEIPSED